MSSVPPTTEAKPLTFRRYKDGDQWKSSHSYNADDLLALAKAADLAHTKIVEARNADAE